jgi:alanyl-tRNA synthetase
VLDKTPFYAESGGQIGDTGVLVVSSKNIRVLDTKKENDLIIHITESLPEASPTACIARVDAKKRSDTCKNHTSTHLLHAALRSILGTHVQQKGSYVGPDRLRFDFSHYSKVADEDIRTIETLINEKIRQNIPVLTHILPLEEAKKSGAMMLFGEKYGDTVRVVTADENFSKEFCGGTHVKATGEIGMCKIVAESAVAAGIRRIEAITGTATEAFVASQLDTINELKQILNTSTNLIKGVQALVQENARIKAELEKYEYAELQRIKNELITGADKTGSVTYIHAEVTVKNVDSLKKLAYELRNETENLFCVLASAIQGKANLVVMISDHLVQEKKLNAVHIIKELGKEIEGGGGGQAFFATAGGKNIAGMFGALEKSKVYLQQL